MKIYGTKEIAEKMGVNPRWARRLLKRAGVPLAGRDYRLTEKQLAAFLKKRENP